MTEAREQTEDRDSALAEVLSTLADRLRAGEHPDVEVIAAGHPDLADEIRELWPAVVLSEEGAAQIEAEDGIPPDATFRDHEILNEIGRGGMGVVYRARQISLGRTVALKVLLHGRLASPADVARFEEEAKAAARLEHPNIVPVHEAGEEGGRPWFTMQLIEGTNLARRLREGPLPPREAAAILLPVARAIQFAHEQGILHRDLKPSNIIIDGEGVPRVCDFGLAKRLGAEGSLTLSGATIGTPGYMAPEQVSAEHELVGPATDVYGLGAILYHAITGHAPHEGPSAGRTLTAVLEQDPVAPRRLNPDADSDLELIAMKCIQRVPELRYPTAAALADDLEAFLLSEPISARSGHFRDVFVRVFRETQYGPVLRNWGMLWIWHSVVLLVICILTNGLKYYGVEAPLPYIGLWTFGLAVWAGLFWMVRRRAGPVTFVERQVAHVWGGALAFCMLLFPMEIVLGLPALTLCPVLAIAAGSMFLAKASILSGWFYLQAGALYVTTFVMVALPSVGTAIFGVVCAACFFIPGLKYARERRRG